MKNVIFFCLTAALSGAGFAQPELEAERGRIAAERARAQAGFAAEGSACYKRFWVNNCLDQVKARRLEVLSDLRRQEVVLNDQERKAKGAEQLLKIEEKSSMATEQAQADRRFEAINKAQSKSEREVQGVQGSSTLGTEQASRAQSGKTSAADRLNANQKKLASRVQKQALEADEANKFKAKQQRAKERQEKNAASQRGKQNSPALPALPAR